MDTPLSTRPCTHSSLDCAPTQKQMLLIAGAIIGGFMAHVGLLTSAVLYNVPALFLRCHLCHRRSTVYRSWRAQC
jgi:hypothetical protein